MSGRYGHDMYDRHELEPAPKPRSRPRIRIETEAETPARIPQGKKSKLIPLNLNQPTRDLRTLVKILVLENENISAEEIAAKLDRVSSSALFTIRHVRVEFHHTLKLLRAHGYLGKNRWRV